MIEWLRELNLSVGKHGEEPLPLWLFYTYIGVSCGLIALAGLMSGLTLGLMSLDELDLEVLKRSGTEQEKKHARRIQPVIANEHFLLVTLLLFNALSTEALPIFLDRLVDPVTAVVLSVSVVLVIGEILPQAVCRSYGLQVGSYSAWLVRILMAISSPVSWPIGKFIDWLLGEEHSAFFRRAQLKALVGLHSSDEGLGGTLTADEISIITGALDLTSKTAWAAMTPLDKVFMLPSDRLLDEATLQEILISGHSRIPLHEPGHRTQLIGIILVKELVLVDPDQGLTAGQLVSRQLPRLPADTPLYQLLRLFEAGGSHMVALTKPSARGSHDTGGGLTSHGSGALQPGAKGLSRVTTPASPLPRIKSGVIKAGDNVIYVEAQQQGLHQGLGGADVKPMGNPRLVGSEPEEDAWGQGREGDPVGIITIEDVIEELLQQEIIDETDLYVDNMQVTRVEQYALTSSLPARLRKAYVQQFTPRIGRLVAHHTHPHPHPGGGSWPHSNAGSSWVHHSHMHLYEKRRPYSNPTTPLNGSPMNQGHPSTSLAAAAEADGSSMMAPRDGSYSSEASGVFTPSRTGSGYDGVHYEQHQFLQRGQTSSEQGQQQQQQGQLVRRHSADGSYMTYTIAALGPQLASGLAARRRSSEQGEGSNHRHPQYFEAVREGVLEGGGSSAGGSSGGGSTITDLQQPLLARDERSDS